MIEIILNDELHHRLHFDNGTIIRSSIEFPAAPGYLPYLRVDIRCRRNSQINCCHFDNKPGKLKVIEDSIDSLNNPLDIPRIFSYRGGIYTICNVKSCEKID